MSPWKSIIVGKVNSVPVTVTAALLGETKPQHSSLRGPWGTMLWKVVFQATGEGCPPTQGQLGSGAFTPCGRAHVAQEGISFTASSWWIKLIGFYLSALRVSPVCHG